MPNDSFNLQAIVPQVLHHNLQVLDILVKSRVFWLPAAPSVSPEVKSERGSVEIQVARELWLKQVILVAQHAMADHHHPLGGLESSTLAKGAGQLAPIRQGNDHRLLHLKEEGKKGKENST